MTEALKKESKKKKGQRLTESQIVDVFDNVCQSGTFERYIFNLLLDQNQRRIYNPVRYL